MATRKTRKPVRKPAAKPVMDTVPRYPLQHTPDRYVLVYAGEHSAFCHREFCTLEALARFVAASDLSVPEYAIVTGRIKRCDPRYKSDAESRLPWDEGDGDVSAGDEIHTSSKPLSRDEVDALIHGK